MATDDSRRVLAQGRARDWTRLGAEGKQGRASSTPKAGEATPRGVLDEPGAGEAIIGARVGIFWEDDETFYKVKFGFPDLHGVAEQSTAHTSIA